jgi:hypothetical protein
MDLDSLYKQLKLEAQTLDGQEKELTRKLEDVKRLQKQNADKRARVNKLEAELAKLLRNSQ